MTLDYHQKYEEIHRSLIQRKSPEKLWGNFFENALIGYFWSSHKDKDESLLGEIEQYLSRHENENPETSSNAVAFGLFGMMMKNRMRGEYEKIMEVALKSISYFLTKDQSSRFSLLNNPELAFFASIILNSEKDKSDAKESNDKILDFVNNALKINNSEFSIRALLFGGCLILLDGRDKITKTIKDRIKALSIEKMSWDEIAYLIWFVENFKSKFDFHDDFLEDLSNQYSIKEKSVSFQENIEFDSGLDYVSIIQLILLDDAFYDLWQGKGTSPKQLWKVLPIHSKLREVTESTFLAGNYENAVNEAFKFVDNYLKEKTRETISGNALVDKTFNFDFDRKKCIPKKPPIVQLNELNKVSDSDEQEGYKLLFNGAITALRNPSSHENLKAGDPYVAIELICFASHLIKRIDKAKLNI